MHGAAVLNCNTCKFKSFSGGKDFQNLSLFLTQIIKASYDFKDLEYYAQSQMDGCYILMVFFVVVLFEVCFL